MKPLLVDVMVNGSFYTQVTYTKRGRPRMVDGKIVEEHDPDEVKQFVLDTLPSIRNKDFSLAFSNQRVLSI